MGLGEGGSTLSFRCARLCDVSVLSIIEQEAWPMCLASSADDIASRIRRFPEWCFVACVAEPPPSRAVDSDGTHSLDANREGSISVPSSTAYSAGAGSSIIHNSATATASRVDERIVGAIYGQRTRGDVFSERSVCDHLRVTERERLLRVSGGRGSMSPPTPTHADSPRVDAPGTATSADTGDMRMEKEQWPSPVALGHTADTVVRAGDPAGSVVQLLAVAVAPAARGCHAGRALVMHAVEAARQARRDGAGIERCVGVTHCGGFEPDAHAVAPARPPATEASSGPAEVPSYAVEAPSDGMGRPGDTFLRWVRHAVSTDSGGRLVDRTLRFHAALGATVGPVVPRYRPRDVVCDGAGVLVEYAL
eukprot:TRINITY_DN46819_c0_g1_i1.p1 TRINITY_DN46819_c0_g1~~TRINITY_DN46819_c0_g1_i1.p1  ORF type:complete len:364 (-),score=23.76 TRINITY_DN46819_c0_g1_i1:403-1494(-)